MSPITSVYSFSESDIYRQINTIFPRIFYLVYENKKSPPPGAANLNRNPCKQQYI
ncbi:hypothetical protein Hanom_Chr11g01043971 [Helianthus anomalus]